MKRYFILFILLILIASCTWDTADFTYTYDGNPHGPEITDNVDKHYSYVGTGSTIYGPSANKPIDVGTYSVTVSGNVYGSYSETKAFTIVPKVDSTILYVTSGTDFFTKAGTTVSADSLVLIPSVDFTINGNSLNRNMRITHTIDSPAISNAYLFASTTSPFSGTLKYKYSVTELNGLSEAYLKPYIYNGTNWQLYYSATNNTRTHYVVSVPLTGVLMNEITLTADSLEIPFLKKPQNQYNGGLNAQMFEVKAFPNPTISSFHIKVTSGSPEMIRVNVYDMNGKRVKELKMSPNESKELGAEFINGMYLMEFIQGNEHRSIQLIKLK